MHWLFKLLIGGGIIYLLICLAFYWLQERFLFFPNKLPDDYQFHFNHTFKEVYITAQDGVRLHAVHFYSPEPKGVILYFHGNAGSLVGWGEVGASLANLGYDVLVYDFRSYGKSGGQPDHQAMLDDGLACYDYLKKHYQEKEIYLYGRSLGTGYASYVAGKRQAVHLILETPYYSINDVATGYFPFLPVKLINRFPINSYQYLDAAEMPVIIFHGTSDEVVPYKSGKKLMESLSGRAAKMITIENAGHNNLADFDLYWKELVKVLP